MGRKLINKACDWLHNHCKTPRGVHVRRDKGLETIAYIFKLERLDKPSVWYIMEVKGDFPFHQILSIKRFCRF